MRDPTKPPPSYQVSKVMPGNLFTRNRSTVCAVVLLATAAHDVAAQVIAPPVVEYEQRAASTFDISNSGLRPLSVVIEPFFFWVDTLGEVHYTPFDTSRVKLELSTMSVRLPPRATYSVRYEARAEHLPAWFVITASFSGARTQGLNVRLQLPHVVYLNQKEPLQDRDVVIRAFEYDPSTGKARFKIENLSDRLGRCYDGSLRSAHGDSKVVPSFPLFPHFVRWVELPWTASSPPEQLELKFQEFTIRATRRQVAGR